MTTVRAPDSTAWAVVDRGIVRARFRYLDEAQEWAAHKYPTATVERQRESVEERKRADEQP